MVDGAGERPSGAPDGASERVSLLTLAYPVRNVWVDFKLPFVDNDSVVWKGQVAVVVDANGEVFQSDGLVFDTPWYYCAVCENQRLGVGTKFCAECGGALDWEHTAARDPDAERAFQAEVNAKVAAIRADLDGVKSAVLSPEVGGLS